MSSRPWRRPPGLWTSRPDGGPRSTSPDSPNRHTFGPCASSPRRASLPVRPHPSPCPGSPDSLCKLPETGCRAHADSIRRRSMYLRIPRVMNSILSRTVRRRSTLAVAITATTRRSPTNPSKKAKQPLLGKECGIGDPLIAVGSRKVRFHRDRNAIRHPPKHAAAGSEPIPGTQGELFQGVRHADGSD